jgi:hypothetical protein
MLLSENKGMVAGLSAQTRTGGSGLPEKTQQKELVACWKAKTQDPA